MKELEPNIQDDVIGALYAKTAGIVGPWELTVAMVEEAILNGVELFLETEVASIKKIDGGFEITDKNSKTFKTKKIINCAGVHSDIIHNMVAEKSFTILPRKGEYFVLDKTQGEKINRTIFQCPTKMGKGVLLTPTVHGNLLVGPDSQDVKDRDDLSTSSERLNYVKEVAFKSSKNIDFREVVRTFSGMRAESDRGDFIIEEAPGCKGLYDVAGIKSPGLTAAPAISKGVIELLKSSDLELESKIKNTKDLKVRKKPIHFMELGAEEKSKIINENPSYGRVICRCEMITEGEIIDTLKTPIKIKTVDSVKKRCRPGMGRCQGGFCGPRVQEIIARELNLSLKEVILDKEGSYILTEETKN